jgi:RimJ/RimL family protein N-acetyltransferase
MREELETERLRLRRWRPEDLDALTRWHNDAELMRHMHKLSFTREEMAADIERYARHWEQHGFGLWAAEDRNTQTLIGRVGLAYHRVWPSDPEVGWLIDTPWQGRGYATEAGAACINYAFGELGFDRVVSICTAQNVASKRVMEKLGFRVWRELHDEKLGLDLLLHVRERDAENRVGMD